MPKGKTAVIFVLDTGEISGYGHLSRSLSLMIELIKHYPIHLIVRGDNQKKVLTFLEGGLSASSLSSFHLLSLETEEALELKLIASIAKNDCNFLVIDHYRVSESYSQFLKSNGLKWLQFDSHAKSDLYSDIVLHASPGATKELYKPLIKSDSTKALLGPEFAIVKDSFRQARSLVSPRRQVNTIFLCFGGGHDKGATSNILNALDLEKFNKIQFLVFIGSSNPNFEAIQNISNEWSNIELHIDDLSLAKYMTKSDLAVITPGTLSYECACLGLPMLLFEIAENQHINAMGWQNTGCALNLGLLENLDAPELIKTLERIKSDPSLLAKMSNTCMALVDGNGPSRVKKEIESIL